MRRNMLLTVLLASMLLLSLVGCNSKEEALEESNVAVQEENNNTDSSAESTPKASKPKLVRATEMPSSEMIMVKEFTPHPSKEIAEIINSGDSVDWVINSPFYPTMMLYKDVLYYFGWIEGKPIYTLPSNNINDVPELFMDDKINFLEQYNHAVNGPTITSYCMDEENGYIYLTQHQINDNADYKERVTIILHRINLNTKKLESNLLKIPFMKEDYTVQLNNGYLVFQCAQGFDQSVVNLSTNEIERTTFTSDVYYYAQSMDYLISNKTKSIHDSDKYSLKKKNGFPVLTLTSRILPFNPESYYIIQNTLYTTISSLNNEGEYFVKVDLDSTTTTDVPQFSLDGELYFGEIIAQATKDEDRIGANSIYVMDNTLHFAYVIDNDNTRDRLITYNLDSEDTRIYESEYSCVLLVDNNYYTSPFLDLEPTVDSSTEQDAPTTKEDDLKYLFSNNKGAKKALKGLKEGTNANLITYNPGLYRTMDIYYYNDALYQFGWVDEQPMQELLLGNGITEQARYFADFPDLELLQPTYNNFIISQHTLDWDNGYIYMAQDYLTTDSSLGPVNMVIHRISLDTGEFEKNYIELAFPDVAYSFDYRHGQLVISGLMTEKVIEIDPNTKVLKEYRNDDPNIYYDLTTSSYILGHAEDTYTSLLYNKSDMTTIDLDKKAAIPYELTNYVIDDVMYTLVYGQSHPEVDDVYNTYLLRVDLSKVAEGTETTVEIEGTLYFGELINQVYDIKETPDQYTTGNLLYLVDNKLCYSYSVFTFEDDYYEFIYSYDLDTKEVKTYVSEGEFHILVDDYYYAIPFSDNTALMDSLRLADNQETVVDTDSFINPETIVITEVFEGSFPKTLKEELANGKAIDWTIDSIADNSFVYYENRLFYFGWIYDESIEVLSTDDLESGAKEFLEFPKLKKYGDGSTIDAFTWDSENGYIYFTQYKKTDNTNKQTFIHRLDLNTKELELNLYDISTEVYLDTMNYVNGYLILRNSIGSEIVEIDLSTGIINKLFPKRSSRFYGYSKDYIVGFNRDTENNFLADREGTNLTEGDTRLPLDRNKHCILDNTLYTLLHEDKKRDEPVETYLVKVDLDAVNTSESPKFVFNGRAYYGEILARVSTESEFINLDDFYILDKKVHYTYTLKENDSRQYRLITFDTVKELTKLYDKSDFDLPLIINDKYTTYPFMY